jgi:ABC-type Fe3+/spermidine/putrescine transport system ATPase subunit
MAGVQLVNVSKRFGKVQAMDRINLDVKSGEVLSLLGPSGCGKTTTLRSIAGLEAPSEGEICIEHRDVCGIPIHKRQVGMVFQDYALFPHLTVQENVAFGLKMHKVPPATTRKKVADALKLVRLTNLPGIEGRYPHRAGTIGHIVYLGTVTHYYVDSAEGEAFVVYVQNQEGSHTCGLWRVGDTVHLSWKPEHTLIVEHDEERSDVIAAKESA